MPFILEDRREAQNRCRKKVRRREAVYFWSAGKKPTPDGKKVWQNGATLFLELWPGLIP